MSKRLAREAAMSLLYEREITGTQDQETLEIMGDILHADKLRETHREYIDGILSLFEEHREEIDEMIADKADTWKFDRLSKVDLSILRLAVVEMFYLEEIPAKVTLNEAVEMAKKYSGEKSSKFVNGVLGAIYTASGLAEKEQEV